MNKELCVRPILSIFFSVPLMLIARQCKHDSHHCQVFYLLLTQQGGILMRIKPK